MRQVFLLICLGLICLHFYNKLNPPILEHCKFALEQSLRSPSTLDIISTETMRSKTATIHYDAANAFGAPIRSVIKCELGEGRLKTLKSVMKNGVALSDAALSTINYALYEKK